MASPFGRLRIKGHINVDSLERTSTMNNLRKTLISTAAALAIGAPGLAFAPRHDCRCRPVERRHRVIDEVLLPSMRRAAAEPSGTWTRFAGRSFCRVPFAGRTLYKQPRPDPVAQQDRASDS